MSEPQDPYGGQPYQPPQYPQYPQYPPYQGHPQYYQQQYPGYPGYPPPMPTGPRAPGTSVAAAVLDFIAGGLLILAAALLFVGASFLHGMGEAFDADTGSVTAELNIDAVLNLVAAGLLISGGVFLLGGDPRGLRFTAIGSGLVAVLAVYWLARADQEGDTLLFSLLFAALVVIAVSLAFSPSSRAYLQRGKT